MKREQLNYFLQHAPVSLLLELCATISDEATVAVIQNPTAQTLLVPVVDPINQGTFFSGEVLVTSAIVAVGGVKGWAMVLDDQAELARALAMLDAAFAAGIRKSAISLLAERGKRAIDTRNQELNQQVETTRVSFDLL